MAKDAQNPDEVEETRRSSEEITNAEDDFEEDDELEDDEAEDEE